MDANFLADLTIFKIVTLIVYVTLAGLSVVALSTGFFKFIQFYRRGVGGRHEAEEVLDDWLSGRVEDAIQVAGMRKLVLTRVQIRIPLWCIPRRDVFFVFVALFFVKKVIF